MICRLQTALKYVHIAYIICRHKDLAVLDARGDRGFWKLGYLVGRGIGKGAVRGVGQPPFFGTHFYTFPL